MTYGKLFKKYMRAFNVVEMSANKCSKLSYRELKDMAKNLYPLNKMILRDYPHMTKSVLANKVYRALLATYDLN